MARKKDFWIPYCDDVDGNITVWKNEANTAMKAVDKTSFPKRLFEFTFPFGLSYEDYKIVSKVEGKGWNTGQEGNEIDVLKVESKAEKSGMYNLDLVKKVIQKDADLYLGVEDGPLFVLNPDGSCGLIACVLTDEFAEVAQ